MSGNLYRVEFHKSEPQFIFADDAMSARENAALNVAAIIRPATIDEMLDWAVVEVEKAQVTMREIQKEFGINCE